MRSGRRRATGADSDAVNANNSVANSAGSSADSSRAAQPVKEEARVEEPRRRGGEVTSRRDKVTGGDGAARQRGSRKGGGHNYAMHIWNTHCLRQEWGGITGWDQYTLPIQDILYTRIWNMDRQFPDNCLAFGGITTGIQRLRHGMIHRISNGLSFGTSNSDSWRLQLSIRCQLLVDHSELCTNVIFNFSQLILEASARKKLVPSSCYHVQDYKRSSSWNIEHGFVEI